MGRPASVPPEKSLLPFCDKKNRDKWQGADERSAHHRYDPLAGADAPLENRNDVSGLRQINETPERQERSHDREECDDHEVAPDEWKHGVPPAAQTAQSVHARGILQRDRDSHRGPQEENETESRNQPVTEPQGVSGRVSSVAVADDQQGRRDPEQLRHHDQRDRPEGSAVTPGNARKRMA